MASEVSPFLGAVRSLLASTKSGEVSLAEFEPRFLRLHSEMPLSTPEPSAKAIEDLFWVVEAFVVDPAIRTTSDPDERMLLARIDNCLSQLAR
ncbi:hypothetical protein GCM10009641_44570 [Mycobacterium cookii]|uniref:Colicin D immunity protein domain-containing protein n=1 Tax=Nocardioides furvisabuli TaxID=375542 RepID=A0ABN2XUP8_9ACTN|nr:hypothetical protein [Nocardioides furvisabuli]